MKPTTSPTVLCVDDEPNVLSALERLLRGRGLRVLVAGGGEAALALLEREPIDVLLSDMRMPGMDGAQLLAIASERWPDTVRLLLTGHSDHDATVRAINAGKVSGYISKPWESLALIGTIESAAQLARATREKAVLEAQNRAQAAALAALNTELEQRVQQRTEEVMRANARLKRNNMMSIKVLVNLIELRGGNLVGHGRRVADLARRMAVALGCGGDEVETVFVAGLLHDIGLIGLPDFTLSQPVTRLEGKQLKLYRRHTTLGEQSLMALEDLQQVAALIRAHHERFDGRGYPDGLVGEQIELGARILAVADSYDELLSGDRGVGGLDAETVKGLLQRSGGTQFDPRVLAALVEVTRPAPQPVEPVRIATLAWSRLEAGMELAADLRSPEGALLLAADQVLSGRIVERIREFARREHPRLELQVRLAAPGADASLSTS